MARIRRSIVPQGSMFPFLSILVCLIGVIALLIGMMVPGQAQAPVKAAAPKSAQPPEKAAEAEAESAESQEKRLREAREKVDFSQADLNRLDQRFERTQGIRAKLEESNEELNDLKTVLQARDQEQKTLKDRKDQLRKEADGLKNDADSLETTAKKVAAETKQLNVELADALQPAPDPANRIRPYSHRLNVVGFFVECRAREIVIYEKEPPVTVRAEDLASSPEYRAFLKRMATVKDNVVVFLLREDALPTYFTARKVAEQNNCRHGKIPLPGQGEVDLSLIRSQVEKDRDKHDRDDSEDEK